MRPLENRVKSKRIYIYAIDFVLLNSAFIISLYIKRGRIFFTLEYLYLLAAYNIIWLIVCVTSNKIRQRGPKTFAEGLRPFSRAFIHMAFFLFFILFIFDLSYFSRFIVLFTMILYMVFEFVFYCFLYLPLWGSDVLSIEEKDEEAGKREIVPMEEILSVDHFERKINEVIRTKLKNVYFKDKNALFDFVDEQLDLERIEASNSILFHSNSRHFVKSLLNDNWEFLGNLALMNDLRYVNKFLIEVNLKLVKGGYFLCAVETLEQRWNRKIRKYPRIFRMPINLFDFLWTRVFPKVGGLKKIYFAIHGKLGRVISETEILGRLYFCGFMIVATKEIENILYLIAKKIKEPSQDTNPSYGTIFKQKRIGKDGKHIYTYKIRTMYAYSEYIHKYYMEKYKLNPLGKVNRDPRITSWGHFMRKNWIDELPMLINYLQGDLKLVGVRPISETFFMLYPDDLKRERIKNKPGIIPTIYADEWNTMEQIFESEREYLRKFQHHPLKTDLSYFFKVMRKIIGNRNKSG